MDNKISFQGIINLTKFERGEKKIYKYVTTPENDEKIRLAASRIFKYYNPNYFKSAKEDQDKPFRKLISDIIGTDIAKKNYFESSIVSYGPEKIIIKDLNRHYKDGIELNITL